MNGIIAAHVVLSDMLKGNIPHVSVEIKLNPIEEIEQVANRVREPVNVCLPDPEILPAFQLQLSLKLGWQSPPKALSPSDID